MLFQPTLPLAEHCLQACQPAEHSTACKDFHAGCPAHPAGCIFLANAAYVQATLTWCLITPFLYKAGIRSSTCSAHTSLQSC